MTFMSTPKNDKHQKICAVKVSGTWVSDFKYLSNKTINYLITTYQFDDSVHVVQVVSKIVESLFPFKENAKTLVSCNVVLSPCLHPFIGSLQWADSQGPRTNRKAAGSKGYKSTAQITLSWKSHPQNLTSWYGSCDCCNAGKNRQKVTLQNLLNFD